MKIFNLFSIFYKNYTKQKKIQKKLKKKQSTLYLKLRSHEYDIISINFDDCGL